MCNNFINDTSNARMDANLLGTVVSCLLWVELRNRNHSYSCADKTTPGNLCKCSLLQPPNNCQVSFCRAHIVSHTQQDAQGVSVKIQVITFRDQCVHASSMENSTPPMGAPNAACK